MDMTMLPRDILAGWKVLIIDDEPDSADVAKSILGYFGAEVVTAGNGKEGIDKLRTFTPSLVVCDISMPVLDGWGVISQLKKNRAWIDIPVIALTAHAMVGDREKAIAAGFHNHLTKPLSPQTFVQDMLILLIDLPQFADIAEKLELE
jgi:CheY-like chemotaxis protein